jgi:D-arabinose 1-dehydrogenase-like Zn-dependent alcohol dehydrogenase
LLGLGVETERIYVDHGVTGAGRHAVQVASMMTANNAWSTRRRRSNSDGKNNADRNFGIRSSRSRPSRSASGEG